jgi:hypothetical protein
MPKTSRTKTRTTKPTKRKGELPVREAAEVEREVTRGEPERGRDVEREAPAHRSSENHPEHQE